MQTSWSCTSNLHNMQCARLLHVLKFLQFLHMLKSIWWKNFSHHYILGNPLDTWQKLTNSTVFSFANFAISSQQLAETCHLAVLNHANFGNSSFHREELEQKYFCSAAKSYFLDYLSCCYVRQLGQWNLQT